MGHTEVIKVALAKFPKYSGSNYSVTEVAQAKTDLLH